MYLELKRVSTHNLKGFDLKIPLNKLVVITGPSGSGKSSLAFDTIFALAKARFLLPEGLASPFTPLSKARGILLSMTPPVVALSQGVREWFIYKNISEILGFSSLLSFLFFEKGQVKCPHCGALNSFQTLKDLISWYNSLKEETKFYFLLPLKDPSPKALSYLISQGYTRFLVDDREYDFSEEEFPRSMKRVYLILDRMIKEEKGLSRLLENVRISQNITRGHVILKPSDGEFYFFNLGNFCFQCGALLTRELLRCKVCRGVGFKERRPCLACEGLKFESYYLESKLFTYTLREILTFTLKEFKLFLEENFSEEEKESFQSVFTLLERGEFFGVDYLRLSTPVFELSLGERKGLEILALFSSHLQGVLYILDEPTLGLDIEKRKKLLFLIRELIEKGNSFVVVEHDLDFIQSADFIIELGPEGGERGGYLLFALPREEYLKEKNTFIYPYLISPPSFEKRPLLKRDFIELSYQGEKVRILREGINLIAGETGRDSDKKLRDLSEILKSQGFIVYEGEEVFSIKGERFLIEYVGVWEGLKEVLVSLPSAKARGLTKRHFSFHTQEGQCFSCKGRGYKKIEIEDFEFETLCEECLGKGLNYEVLNLTYKGYKIFELLDFTVEEALPLFGKIYSVKEILHKLGELNLFYLRLSQRLSELSGGEKLRVELARRLRKREKLDFLVLYYPFQGLSIKDLENLSKFFRKLNLEGITILMRETHPLASLMSDQIL